MSKESYYEKRQRILKEQKARKEAKDKANKKAGLEDVIIKPKPKKPKSSKLGSATPSKGSQNPTSAFQNMKKKDIKKSTFFQDIIAGPKTEKKKLEKVDVGLSEAMKKKRPTGMSPRALGGKVTAKKKSGKTITPTKSKKPTIVTKEQLAKSGLSLRDYMNFLQGKTRRDDKKTATKKKTSAKIMVDNFKKSNVKANKNKKAGRKIMHLLGRGRIDAAKGDNKKVKTLKKKSFLERVKSDFDKAVKETKRNFAGDFKKKTGRYKLVSTGKTNFNKKKKKK